MDIVVSLTGTVLHSQSIESYILPLDSLCNRAIASSRGTMLSLKTRNDISEE
jgi:hypothetical protein